MSNIAVITARGGSKRIPKKNIKDFCGKPIIAYSIEAALKAGIYDEVMVSTDSEEIAEIAKRYGAKVPFLRSAETSNDFATTADVIKEVIREYSKLGREFDILTCIYPTAPFITTEKLIAGINLLKEKNANQVIPLVPFSFPPMRGTVIDEDGYVHFKWEEYRKKRSQDIEPMYHDCGQFYIYNVKEYIANNGTFSDGIVPMIISELEVQDIDNETDWKLAELKYRLVNNIE